MLLFFFGGSRVSIQSSWSSGVKPRPCSLVGHKGSWGLRAPGGQGPASLPLSFGSFWFPPPTTFASRRASLFLWYCVPCKFCSHFGILCTIKAILIFFTCQLDGTKYGFLRAAFIVWCVGCSPQRGTLNWWSNQLFTSILCSLKWLWIDCSRLLPKTDIELTSINRKHFPT